jgi:hypothetical protein
MVQGRNFEKNKLWEGEIDDTTRLHDAKDKTRILGNSNTSIHKLTVQQNRIKVKTKVTFNCLIQFS